MFLQASSSSDIEYPEQNMYAPQPIIMAEQLRNIPYEMMGTYPKNIDELN